MGRAEGGSLRKRSPALPVSSRLGGERALYQELCVGNPSEEPDPAKPLRQTPPSRSGTCRKGRGTQTQPERGAGEAKAPPPGL